MFFSRNTSVFGRVKGKTNSAKDLNTVKRSLNAQVYTNKHDIKVNNSVYTRLCKKYTKQCETVHPSMWPITPELVSLEREIRSCEHKLEVLYKTQSDLSTALTRIDGTITENNLSNVTAKIIKFEDSLLAEHNGRDKFLKSQMVKMKNGESAKQRIGSNAKTAMSLLSGPNNPQKESTRQNGPASNIQSSNGTVMTQFQSSFVKSLYDKKTCHNTDDVQSHDDHLGYQEQPSEILVGALNQLINSDNVNNN